MRDIMHRTRSDEISMLINKAKKYHVKNLLGNKIFFDLRQSKQNSPSKSNVIQLVTSQHENNMRIFI